MENTPGSDVEIISKTLQVEHKIFYFDLKENPRGQYLKISEKTSGSRSTIIIPVSGINAFVDLFKYYAAGDSGKESSLESSEVQLDTKVVFFYLCIVYIFTFFARIIDVLVYNMKVFFLHYILYILPFWIYWYKFHCIHTGVLFWRGREPKGTVLEGNI